MSPENVVLLSAAYIYLLKRNRKKKKRYWVRNYLLEREKNVRLDSSISDESFNSFTRMSKTDFELLLEMIGPSITKQSTNFRTPVNPECRLAITLKYLATGNSYTSLSYIYKVSKQLISQIIPEVCEVLINVLKDYVKTPSNTQKWKNKADDFQTIWNFPHCIGAIDGKHVRIEIPTHRGVEYHNNEDISSIILLSIIDANYNFIYANSCTYGRSLDCENIEDTSLYKTMIENCVNIPQPEPLIPDGVDIPYVFISDNGFPLSQNMLKPYPDNDDHVVKEHMFNYRISKARRVVENVFGNINVVFRVFRKAMSLKPANCQRVVMSCVYLHNFLMRNESSRALYVPFETFDYEDAEGITVEGSWRRELDKTSMLNVEEQDSNAAECDLALRDQFAEYFMSPEGSN